MERQFFKRDTFCYNVANFGSDNRMRWDPPTDICQYRTRVLLGAFKLLVFILLLALPVMCVVSTFISIPMCLSNGISLNICMSDQILPLPAIFGIVIIVISLIMGIFIGIVYSFTKMRTDMGISIPKISIPDNTVFKLYRSWKDKVCYPIGFGTRYEPTQDEVPQLEDDWENF